MDYPTIDQRHAARLGEAATDIAALADMFSREVLLCAAKHVMTQADHCAAAGDAPEAKLLAAVNVFLLTKASEE